jgi:hypothetical protein
VFAPLLSLLFLCISAPPEAYNELAHKIIFGIVFAAQLALSLYFAGYWLYGPKLSMASIQVLYLLSVTGWFLLGNLAGTRLCVGRPCSPFLLSISTCCPLPVVAAAAFLGSANGVSSSVHLYGRSLSSLYFNGAIRYAERNTGTLGPHLNPTNSTHRRWL